MLNKTLNSVTERTGLELKNRLVRQFKATPYILPIVLVLLVGIAVYAFHGQSAGSGCRTVYNSDGTIIVGKNYINVEIAHTDAQKKKGLSGRNCIGPNQGMLFIFDQIGTYGFWMKDMHFPIDIVWIDPSGQVIYVKHDVQPNSYPKVYRGPGNARNIIEVGSGRADALGLLPGVQLRYDPHLSHLLE